MLSWLYGRLRVGRNGHGCLKDPSRVHLPITAAAPKLSLMAPPLPSLHLSSPSCGPPRVPPRAAPFCIPLFPCFVACVARAPVRAVRSSSPRGKHPLWPLRVPGTRFFPCARTPSRSCVVSCYSATRRSSATIRPPARLSLQLPRHHLRRQRLPGSHPHWWIYQRRWLPSRRAAGCLQHREHWGCCGAYLAPSSTTQTGRPQQAIKASIVGRCRACDLLLACIALRRSSPICTPVPQS